MIVNCAKMKAKNIISNFNVFSITLIYFIFSCGYVTHCSKTKISNSYIFSSENNCKLHAQIKTGPQSSRPKGGFLSRPRVISNNYKAGSIPLSVIIEKCIFLCTLYREYHNFFNFSDLKILFAFDHIAFLGNWRI